MSASQVCPSFGGFNQGAGADFDRFGPNLAEASSEGQARQTEEFAPPADAAKVTLQVAVGCNRFSVQKPPMSDFRVFGRRLCQPS